jgi:integrase
LETSETRRSTFEEFSKEWFQTYAIPNNKPSEQRNKLVALNNHLIPCFGKLQLKDIGVIHIERFKQAQIQEGIRAKTINNWLCILSKCLESAIEWGLLEHKPKIKPLKVQPQSFDFLSLEESTRLINSCDEQMWKQMITVALRTGMRLGELFGLEWGDVDFQRKMITVRQSIVRGYVGSPKSNKFRYLPLTEEVCKTLYESRRTNGFVFPRPDGTVLTHHIAERALHRASVKAGLRHIGWHVLRHTFASDLVTEGVPMRAIQELLGHSTITMTMRYAHLAPSSLREATDVLERRAQRGQNETKCQPAVNLEKLLTSVLDQ